LVRVARSELIALVVAALALGAAWRALRWGMEKADPRAATVRQIRAEAEPTRDVVVVTEESRDLLGRLAPLPAVIGMAPLDELKGFRRLYVAAAAEGSFGPFAARLGTPSARLGTGARRWDLEGIATVHWSLADALLERVQARREGGAHDGPCVREGTQLRCSSPDVWNHLRAENHAMDGVPIRCVFAHPQEQSRLVLEAHEVPAGRMLVGIVGLDDAAIHAHGAPVVNHIRFEPEGGGAPVELDVVAPNQRGVTPYRLDLGGRGGSISFAITTRNAGARSYCFTAFVTS
jgi:hypothetical protein